MNVHINDRTALLLLIFVVLGVYYPVIFSPLNPIDDQGIYNYLLNTDLFSLTDIFSPVGSANYYRPVLWVTFWIDKYVWGLEESFMHLGNLILHLLNSLILFAVARKAALLQGIRSSIVPFMAAFFFAMHPINTEPVNWIAGRSDVLAAFFVLLTVLILLYRQESVLGSLVAATCLIVGCLAKETAIFFLPMAVVSPLFISQLEENRPSFGFIFLRNKFHFLVFFVAGFVFFIIRSLALGSGDKGIAKVLSHVAGGQGDGLQLKLQIFLKAAGFYLKKLFMPFPLNFSIVHVSDLYLLPGIFVILLLFWLLTKRSMIAFFLLSAASIGSSALLVPLLKATWTPLAERYLYIPSAFFVVGITLIVCRLSARGNYRSLLSVLVGGFALVAIYGTASRTLLWQDNLALFEDTLKKSPGFKPIQNQVVNAYFAVGKDSQALSLASSINVSEDSDDYQYSLLSRAGALAQAGDFVGARDLYETALENPGNFEGHLLRGLLSLYKNQGKAASPGNDYFLYKKVYLLTRLYELGGDPFYLYRLGQAYLALKDIESAHDAFSRCAKIAPVSAYYRQAAQTLSLKLAKQKNRD